MSKISQAICIQPKDPSILKHIFILKNQYKFGFFTGLMKNKENYVTKEIICNFLKWLHIFFNICNYNQSTWWFNNRVHCCSIYFSVQRFYFIIQNVVRNNLIIAFTATVFILECTALLLHNRQCSFLLNFHARYFHCNIHFIE